MCSLLILAALACSQEDKVVEILQEHGRQLLVISESLSTIISLLHVVVGVAAGGMIGIISAVAGIISSISRLREDVRLLNNMLCKTSEHPSEISRGEKTYEQPKLNFDHL